MTLELLGFAALVLFAGYLCTRVRAGGWLATAALAGGVIAIAVKLASVAPMFAAYVLRDGISPEMARVLTDMGGAAFVVDWLPTGVFVACAAGAALATRTLGRTLGWGGVVAGSAAVIVTAVTGAHVLAANALPFLFCLLWILVVSVRLGVQRTSRVRGGAGTGCGAGQGVIIAGLPRRPGNRHHEAVGVATESRAGWAVAGVSAGVMGFWLVLGGLGEVGRHGFGDFAQNVYPNIVFGLAFPVAGALILSRLPGHRLGWLYCLCGLASSVTLAAYAYAQRGLVERPGSLPGALAAGWVSSWIWVCGFSSLLTFGVLWFPDGRLPSRRWWPVAAVAGLAVGLGVTSARVAAGPAGKPSGPRQPARRPAAPVLV